MVCDFRQVNFTNELTRRTSITTLLEGWQRERVKKTPSVTPRPLYCWKAETLSFPMVLGFGGGLIWVFYLEERSEGSPHQIKVVLMLVFVSIVAR